MFSEVRRQLLREYAVALNTERAAWERVHGLELTEAERCLTLNEWKHAAARLKDVVRCLRAAEQAPMFQPESEANEAVSLNKDSLLVSPAPVEYPGVPSLGRPRMLPRRRALFNVRVFAGTLRMIAQVLARLELVMPRLR